MEAAAKAVKNLFWWSADILSFASILLAQFDNYEIPAGCR
jgi:hypothetical protein